MEFEEAALAVLREECRPLHWTVIQDLALRRVTVTGHDELQNRRGAVRAGRLRDERLRRIAVGVADRDAPRPLDACNQLSYSD